MKDILYLLLQISTGDPLDVVSAKSTGAFHAIVTTRPITHRCRLFIQSSRRRGRIGERQQTGKKDGNTSIIVFLLKASNAVRLAVLARVACFYRFTFYAFIVLSVHGDLSSREWQCYGEHRQSRGIHLNRDTILNCVTSTGAVRAVRI